MNTYSLVIPVYNEENNINKLFKELVDVKLYEILEEIIFIDDKSTDKTLTIIKQIVKVHNKVKLIKNNNNMGQSFSLYQGVKNSIGQTILTMDGDLQNDPLDFFKLIEHYNNKKKFKLVGGIRSNRKDTYIKKLSSKLANKIRKFIFKDNCDDSGCSLKIFDRESFLKFPYFNGIHRFLPALFAGLHFNTYFINVNHRNRLYGKSKYGTIIRLFRGIYDLFRVSIIIKKLNKK
tara:strand:- start:686 stop:1384 length:699 start_codon:yes stop_codon:yes gene_type:complete